MRTRIVFSLLVFMLAVSCTAPLESKTTPTPPLPTPTPVFTPTPQLSTPTKVFTPTLQLPTPTPTFTPNPSGSAMSPYAADGQYTVVYKDDYIRESDKETGNNFERELWYPIANGASEVAQGPFPLVVFSPGLGSSGKDYESLISPLASHGFIFISGVSLNDLGTDGTVFRLHWTQKAIEIAEKLNAPGGELAGMIDMEHVAVVGHSTGGWTALIGGGAQLDFGWCTAHPNTFSLYPDSNCLWIRDNQQKLATLLGLKSTPSGLWPQMAGKHVAAVISLAPDGDVWGKDYEGLATVKAPTMIMTGSEDSVNPPEVCAYPIYEHLGSPDKSLVVVKGGEHDIAKNVNDWSAIRHMMVAFLLYHLKSDSEALEALAPANVTFPDVEYKTTGNGAK
jgi:predicted dienelactone hydrolase